MITAESISNKSAFTLYYKDGEEVSPRKPIGVEDMPEEWKWKLKPHRFKPSAFHVIENARLAGPNLAGMKGEDLILSVGYYGRFDLWDRNKPYWEWVMLCSMNPPKRLECVFSMAGVWSGNYFHWIVDHLPTLEAYFAYKTYANEEPVVLLGANAPAFAKESLDELKIPYTVDDHGHYIVDRLVVPTWTREDGYVRPSAVQFLKGIFPENPNRFYRNIYISRRNALTRRLTNEEAVEEFLLTKGFGTEIMENLPFREQRRRIAEAVNVYGPHGAGIVNVIFGRSPNTVEFVQPGYTNPCCWLVGDAAGCQYGFVIGEQENREDLWLDPKKLQLFMEEMA